MGGSSGKQTQSGDPALAAFNQIFNREFSSGLEAAGGIRGITAPRALAMPGQQERDILSQITARGQSPIFGTSAGSQFSRLMESLGPAAQQQFQQVVGPQTLNQFTAGGFSPGSGAVTEALANAGAGISRDVTNLAAGLAPQAFAQEMGGLQMALGAAGAPRMAQLGEESRLGDILLQILGRGPMASGAGSATTSTSPDMLGPLANLAGTGLLAFAMCWVAEAIYGRGSEEHLLAREWIGQRWQGPVAAVVRWAYRRWGRWAAKQAWLLPWLTPLFDMAVRRCREARAIEAGWC